MHLIFGLGNPGRKYAGSRHNMGFEVLDLVAKHHEIKFKASKFDAYAGEGFIGVQKIILVKPTTYMNASGLAVLDFVRYYRLPPEDWPQKLIVVVDDVNLPAGRIRIRQRGGAGGHNGLKNILYHLETEDFLRLRVGVGSKPEGVDLSGHVLSKIVDNEGDGITRGVITAAQALEDIIRHGAVFAMNQHNIRPELDTGEDENDNAGH